MRREKLTAEDAEDAEKVFGHVHMVDSDGEELLSRFGIQKTLAFRRCSDFITKARKYENAKEGGNWSRFVFSVFRDKKGALVQGDCIGRRVRNIPRSGFSRPIGNPRP